MAERPILYSFRRCPYAMRARMGLWASGTACELREVVLARKPQAMLDASPKGTVPVLVLPDGSVIEESLEILRWALARNDPKDWLERDDPDLIHRNDGAFKHHLDRYKYHTRYDCDPIEHRTAALDILHDLDARLQSRANLCGEKRGLADIALFPFIRQFANTDRAWFDVLPLAGLQRWLKRHLASDLFASIMAKYPAWQAGDPPTQFGPS